MDNYVCAHVYRVFMYIHNYATVQADTQDSASHPKSATYTYIQVYCVKPGTRSNRCEPTDPPPLRQLILSIFNNKFNVEAIVDWVSNPTLTICHCRSDLIQERTKDQDCTSFSLQTTTEKTKLYMQHRNTAGRTRAFAQAVGGSTTRRQLS